MLFRLSNASANFQGYINKILAKNFDIVIIIYLDDIFIYIEDPDQSHVAAVQWVLDILRKHSLFVNFKKCHFCKNKICFLGYAVLSQKIKIKDKKIEKVRNWPESKSVRDI